MPDHLLRLEMVLHLLNFTFLLSQISLKLHLEKAGWELLGILDGAPLAIVAELLFVRALLQHVFVRELCLFCKLAFPAFWA